MLLSFPCFSKEGCVECAECHKGFYSNSTCSPSCEPCPTGQYVNTSGSSECQPCGIGYYSNTTGSAECIECQPGIKFHQKINLIEKTRLFHVLSILTAVFI